MRMALRLVHLGNDKTSLASLCRFPQMPGIDRGPQRTGDQAVPQPGLYLQQPQMASSNKAQWASGTPHVVITLYRI